MSCNELSRNLKQLLSKSEPWKEVTNYAFYPLIGKRNAFLKVVCMLCTIAIVWLYTAGAQDKAQAYRDDEVTQALTAINLQHAQMQKSGSTQDHTVRIDNDVHVERAKHMLEDYKPDENRTPSAHAPAQAPVRGLQNQRPDRPPTFTRPLLNTAVAVEGKPAKYILHVYP
jgi:hypothetical protein